MNFPKRDYGPLSHVFQGDGLICVITMGPSNVTVASERR